MNEIVKKLIDFLPEESINFNTVQKNNIPFNIDDFVRKFVEPSLVSALDMKFLRSID
jgi:hypothetical protein